MKIIKIISEWKRPAKNLAKGFKRVEAVIEENGLVQTRHIDIPKEQNS